MSLRYTVRHKDPNPSGKFLHRERAGTESAGGRSHHGWTYQLIKHRTGTTVARTVYNVSIVDPHGSRAGYLQGFSTPDQAGAAAQEWIGERSAATDCTPNNPVDQESTDVAL